MPPKYRTPIILSAHAIQRWHERVGWDKPMRMQGKLRNAISSALKRGVNVRNGTATINVVPGLRAVVAPNLTGGWIVITVMDEAEGEEVG